MRTRQEPLNRRQLLNLGGVALLSPGLLHVLAGRAAADESPPRPARIKSCLLLFQAGGVSQTDTFDMKPDCDETIRGEFRPIASNVQGMHVCEHMPLVARQMDKVRVVRSMHHRMLCHNPAIYCSLSGREVGESLAVSVKTFASREDYPHFGSVVSRLKPRPVGLPPFVALPYQLRNGKTPSPGQHAGFLGHAYDPLVLLQDPSAPDFAVDELVLPNEVPATRFDDRRGLLAALDDDLRAIDQTLAIDAVDEYYRRAFSLVGGPEVKRAFDLSREPDALREKYGRNLVGQSTLLGRRLIEAGVPFVTVYTPVANIDDPSWDTHQNNFPRLKDDLLPPADRALAAVLEDMHDRGLLAETLVIWAGEFGRTPQIGVNRSNNTANQTGRDHWPNCYTILLAGGGIPCGSYFGASDRLGWYPKDNPVHIGDFAASLYEALGIDPHQTIPDTLGRPHVLAEGTPVAGLFS